MSRFLHWKRFSLIVCQSLLKFLTVTTILNIKNCILKLSHSSLCDCFVWGFYRHKFKAAAVGNMLLCLGSWLKYHSLDVLSNYYLAEGSVVILQIWYVRVCWWGTVLTEVVYLVSLVKLFWTFKLVWRICAEPSFTAILLKSSLWAIFF